MPNHTPFSGFLERFGHHKLEVISMKTKSHIQVVKIGATCLRDEETKERKTRKAMYESKASFHGIGS